MTNYASRLSLSQCFGLSGLAAQALLLVATLSSCVAPPVVSDTAPLTNISALTPSGSQQVDPKLIDEATTHRILSDLAADDMQGRRDGSKGAQKAARYIENQFETLGLKPLDSLSGFRQSYSYLAEVGINDPRLAIQADNIIGVIEGQDLADEWVIFSAHYDHLGIKKGEGDQIFNGANDNASGVTALIQLAQYFQQQDNNRSLIFVAFSGEEAGGFGSQAFSKLVDPDQVVAMFNIEMIGTDSKWGKNSAFITGFDHSDFGTILQQNLKDSKFRFYPDPYPEQALFYRSDNATLAAQGVPAHTISTSKMDHEPTYHSVADEIDTLDIPNMTAIIQAIALSATSIIEGQSTPTRINTTTTF